MKDIVFSEVIKFLPFHGEKYWDDDIKCKIFVLGESHYIKDENTKIDEQLTRNVVSDYIEWRYKGRWWNFYSGIIKVIFGNDENRAEKYSRIAFANFVQEIVSNTPRKRPKADMWKNSKEVFEELVNKLQPDIILALGNEVWAHLPWEINGNKAKYGKTVKHDNLEIPTFIYDIGKKVTVYKVRHPSGGLNAWNYHQALSSFFKF
ncbi:MAG: hypothetical protein FWE47_00420 [Oscillospiraceae bacterium]|nr:hypothetical protein [Oscillospiraceae bacterium]